MRLLPNTSFLALLAALLAWLFIAPGMALADKLHLKDGRVLDGTVVREVDGYVWFKFKIGTLEHQQMFKPTEIDRIVRDESKPAEVAAAPAAKPDAKAARKSGAPKAAVISLGEADKNMVGIYFTADSLRRAIPMLEQEGVEVVVFRIKSGGGFGSELQPLVDVIDYEYKPRFRVVAWIESAISAAAMTAHIIEEIYMMPQAQYGGCTGFRGQGDAVKGRELEEMLFQMEKISDRGGHDRRIMRAMQIMEPLSCTIDENGDVHWYQTTSGDHIVNPEGRVLTFNAADAVRYRFARAIVGNIDELGKAMGYSEVEWVGKTVPGVPYPVSRAEQYMREFRDRSDQDSRNTRRYFMEYNQAVQIASGMPADERGPFIGRARRALDRIRAMIANNPNFAYLVLNVNTPQEYREWLEQREEELRQLSRR
jgi:membrane-bound ClpP family serine protease